MADIFLSYKKEDRATAEAIVAALREAGKSVWWDDALNPKQAWDAMIEREIAEAKKVLVLWSPRSVKSDWVRSEAHYAQDHHKLVPVKIEECSLPLAFMLRQAVDLSSGDYSADNPEWQKLLAWIEGEEPTPPASDDASAAPTPTQGTKWLNPARKKGLMAGLTAISLTGMAGLLWATGAFDAAPPQPDVIVDAFELRSEELPASFASSLADEMSADFSASSRISPTFGDGTRNPEAYQLGGNIETDEENVRLFTRIFAPGIEAPILTTRIETDREYEGDAARILGSQVARLTRCIATASDSTGSEIVRLPEAAIKPWAKFCQQLTIDNAAADAKLGTLQDVVDAAPDFANGWANLAEMHFFSSLYPNVDAKEAIDAAAEAADRALAIDGKSAKAMAVKAMIAMGILGDPSSEDKRVPFGDLAEWERLATASVEVRQSDCGCEGPQFAVGLEAIGRPSAGLGHLREAVDADPRNTTHLRDYADMLSTLGRYEAALAQLDELEELWPAADMDSRRYAYALQNGRPADVLKYYRASLGERPEQPEFVAMLEALASKDQARIETVIAPVVASAGQPNGSSPYYLAMAGKNDAAGEAIDALYDRSGPGIFRMVWTPVFSEFRKTEKFAALAKEAGLTDYWKSSGRKPDMCNGTAAQSAKVCAAL